LVSTIYMVPLSDLQAEKPFAGLAVAGEAVQSVDLTYNAGHPGIEAPHYHIVLWHVDPAAAELQQMASRRDLGRMALGGLVAAAAPALLLPAARAQATAATVEIRMRSSADGGRAWFDPLGLLIAPGTLVRWVVEANVHTATAYHPANGG